MKPKPLIASALPATATLAAAAGAQDKKFRVVRVSHTGSNDAKMG